MTPVLSREQVRALDAYAIDTCGVPSLVLMENAGRGASEVIARVLGDRIARVRIEIVCGTGNNGGDGFVVARHLVNRGANVRAWLVGASKKMSPDARANHDAFVGIGGIVRAIEPSDAKLAESIADADVVIDALFGTGLDRPIGAPWSRVVDAINAARGERIALDLPSGLDANKGSGEVVVRADQTVTFAHWKMGLFSSRGAEVAGEVTVVEIGVPPSFAEKVGTVAHVLEPADVASWIAPRPKSAHKYSVGHVAVFAGSPGKTGASLMVAHGALRAGAGAATIATWPDAVASLESRVMEVMTTSLSTKDVAKSVASSLQGKRAVVVGPGFGIGRPARSVIEQVLAQWSGPAIVDADALTIFAGNVAAFADTHASLVLTPHAGELGRLLGKKPDEIEADRLASVCAAAKKANAVVLLKGTCTLIASPDGRVVVNRAGTAALATAGSGDVLAGTIGALACSLAPFEAACAGVYVHARAAEIWQTKRGDRGMLASEIADRVPYVLAALVREHAAIQAGHRGSRRG